MCVRKGGKHLFVPKTCHAVQKIQAAKARLNERAPFRPSEQHVSDGLLIIQSGWTWSVGGDNGLGLTAMVLEESRRLFEDMKGGFDCKRVYLLQSTRKTKLWVALPLIYSLSKLCGDIVSREPLSTAWYPIMQVSSLPRKRLENASACPTPT